MGIPIKSLAQFQRHWYAQLIVAAILSDGEISQPETEFIKQITKIVKDPVQKRRLLNCLAVKTPPPLERPPGMPPKLLAAIFLELSLILISDIEFTDTERKFLEDIAQLFGFTEDYYKELLKWCEQGLAWKTEQKNLAASNGKFETLQVPVSELTPDQQKWYAETLIATIMSDQQLDVQEVSFLKTAITLVQDPEHRQVLTTQIRNNKTPPLSKPPGLSSDILVLVFVEVMLIISADEELGDLEKVHLKELADLCGFSPSLLNRLLTWCKMGMLWKKSKNPLISRCQIKPRKSDRELKIFKEEKTEAEQFQVFSGEQAAKTDKQIFSSEKRAEQPATGHPSPETIPNPENNSIIDYNLSCYICNTKHQVKFFHLKNKSQKPSTNIFGIPTYLKSLEGFDHIDYNRCKVAICPSCFFASTQKNLFKQKKDKTIPEPLQHSKLSATWMQNLEERRTIFKEQMNELSSINRSLLVAIKTFQMAIKSSTILAELNNSPELGWHTITLKLTMAELLMNNGKQKQAESLLKQIQKRSHEIFDSVDNNMISFRSGRLLFLAALYFGDATTASQFYDFFRDIKADKFDRLNKDEQILFKRIYGEVKRAFEDRVGYSRNALNGFHHKLQAKKPSKAQ